MHQTCTEIPHKYPFLYFLKPYQISSWLKAKFFIYRCKRAIFQFIVIKIIITLFLLLVYPNYQFRERQSTEWDYEVYLNVKNVIYWILGISSYMAYYYMCLFNTCLEEPLKPFKPQLKFLSINAIVFFTYWQKIWIAVFRNNILNCF